MERFRILLLLLLLACCVIFRGNVYYAHHTLLPTIEALSVLTCLLFTVYSLMSERSVPCLSHEIQVYNESNRITTVWFYIGMWRTHVVEQRHKCYVVAFSFPLSWCVLYALEAIYLVLVHFGSYSCSVRIIVVCLAFWAPVVNIRIGENGSALNAIFWIPMKVA